MDITLTSRHHFPHPSPTPSEKISLAASSTVYTYHCLCTHLLLATSTPLSHLPTRQNALDAAHIMPLPPPPPPSSTAKKGVAKAAGAVAGEEHYGLLLSTRLDAMPAMVTSDEGFEKRYLQRCGRCGLVVGYQLDWAQFPTPATSIDGSNDRREGRREDIVYLLPGGFVTTSEMIMGKTKTAPSTSTSTSTAGDQALKSGGAGVVSVTEVKV